jgi:hypothetical protein
MIELIALAAALGAAIAGYRGARNYTFRRLRYTAVGEHPAASGIAAGVGTALVAGPVVALLPIIGAGTAIALGAGVGTGVVSGARGRFDSGED